MAKLPLKSTFASETADSFGGIDRTDSVGRLSDAYEMANFRVLPNGSLARREGYGTFLSFPSPVRCAVACPSDPNYMFVLAGELLYSVNLSTNRCLELSRGFNLYAPAFFFCIDNMAYLFCEGYCGVRPDELVFMDGYVPLVGHNWGADGGPVYEQQNMLAFQIRIDYLLDRDAGVLYTGHDLSAIDAVYVNGKQVTGAYFERQNVCLPAVFPKGTRILLCLSLALSEMYDVLTLMSATSVYSCGHGKDSMCVAYGTEEHTRLFFATHVSDEQLAESQAYYPDSSHIYCPATPTYVKNLTGGIRAVCGEPDCLIVAGQNEVRRVTSDGDTLIPGMEGCDSSVSMAYFDGNAYVATPQGIWRLPLRSGKGEIISAPLGNLMDSDVSSKALLYYNVYRNELWVKDTTSNNNTIYIYDPVGERWVCFVNIGAEGFFDYAPGRSIGFWSQLQLMRFVNDQSYDVPPGGVRFPIPAYFISRWTHLDKPHATKRLRRAQLTYTGRGQVYALLSDEDGDLCQHAFSPTPGNDVNFCDDPIRSGRTDQLRATLFSNDERELVIHGFSLSAIK